MSDDQPIRILFVEDVPQDVELAEHVLHKEGLVFTSSRVETRDDFLAALATFQPDLIISDYHMPEFDGMQALRLSLADAAVRPVIVLTGSLNEETAVTCIKAGATDYVLKDRLARLPFAVKEALEQKQTRLARQAAEQALRAASSYNRRLIEASIDPLVTIGPDGKITDVNEATETVTGASRERLIGDNFSNYFTEPEKANEGYQKVLAEGMVRDYPLTIRHASGQTTDVLYNATVYKNEAGEIEGVFAAARDITERKRAEEALYDQQQVFRTLVENSPDIIARYDRDCRRTYVNPIYLKVAQIPPQELLVTSPIQRSPLPEASATVLQNLLRKVLDSGVAEAVDVIWPKADNIDYWYNIYASPEFDREGRVVSVMTISRDITERKQAEAALRQRVIELELLYESGLAFSQLLSPGEIGQKVIDLLAQKLAWHHTTIRLYHPHDETLELLAFEQTGLTGEAERRTVEERFRTLIARPGQGLSGWVVQHGQVVRSGDLAHDPRYLETVPDLRSGLYVPMKVGERVIGVISVEDRRPDAFSAADEQLVATLATQAASALENARLFNEIRQRLTEMEALHTISAALRAAPSHAEMLPVIVHVSFDVLKSAGAALAMREPKTGEMIIVFGQGRWADRTGQRLPPGIGVSGHVIATGRTHVSHDVERDPHIMPVSLADDLRSIAAAPLIAQEQVTGALVAGRDIDFSDEDVRLLAAIADIAANALQRAEVLETLEQRVADRTRELAAANERLQELDRLKSKFVSDVSHELRTPVTSMSLYIDLLVHGKPEKRDFYITRLEQQMARLRAMIEEILDLARLERDQHEVSLTPIDLNSIVEHVVATQQAAVEAASLQLTCEVAEQTLLVLAQPEQLSRAVTNLVANAIKYTRSGRVEVTTATNDDRVCIRVTDTGIGITPEDMPHLFERFYRGKQVAQSNIPGTGLGLAIVKEIVEAHGGTVDVESQLDVGSTFRLWLPAVMN